MHWWTLLLGIVLGMFVLPTFLKMFTGGGKTAAG